MSFMLLLSTFSEVCFFGYIKIYFIESSDHVVDFGVLLILFIFSLLITYRSSSRSISFASSHTYNDVDINWRCEGAINILFCSKNIIFACFSKIWFWKNKNEQYRVTSFYTVISIHSFNCTRIWFILSDMIFRTTLWSHPFAAIIINQTFYETRKNASGETKHVNNGKLRAL